MINIIIINNNNETDVKKKKKKSLSLFPSFLSLSFSFIFSPQFTKS